MRDHLLVDTGVDLHEIQRREGELQVVRGQRVMQLDVAGLQGVHAVGAARLQQDRETVFAAERRQLGPVRIGQRLQVAEHQYPRVIAGREFDLRDRRRALHVVQQRAQRIQLFAEHGIQHVAMREVGHEARVAFAETDQRPALLDDMLDRKARAPAIAPHVCGQRRQPARGLDVADAREVLRQHILLGRDLRGRRQMLQRAAAACSEMPAARRDAVGRGAEDFLGTGLVEMAMLASQARAHPFAGQRVGHEHGLALDPRDTAAVVGKVFDGGFERDVARRFSHPRMMPDASSAGRVRTCRRRPPPRNRARPRRCRR